ncbi:S-layer homology domain-containing protein [Lysinibacillus sp. LZ02]|uniref:S-layer homology domain-containing protein n=1 Tax=Lysinibacillus sp. LZ02 TaxID=3420668 RepID=UPI003D36348F
MAYQPKSYKKFVATAATATLVASAIVPVASASGFSDVPADNEFATYINALTEAGIIGGYASDNTFRPNNKLTRGQVAIMLGRWLENNGATIPADWDTNPRFEDVSTSNEELAKYAALVKDTGVFTGVAGKLNAADNITRENMAVVLDRISKTVTGTSLVELAAEIEDVTVEDLEATQYGEQVQALADLGITTVSNFRPKETVSRAQFAKFLYQSIEVIESTDKEQTTELAGVEAVGAKKIAVTFKEAVDTTKAKFEVKKGTVTSNISEITWNEDKTVATIELTNKLTAGDYVVAVSGLTEEALTKTIVAADEKVAKIDILSDKAVVSVDGTSATVGYTVSNQYGEDLTNNTSLTVTASGVAVNASPDTAAVKGNVTFKTATGAKEGDLAVVTLIHTGTGVAASQTVTLSAKSAVTEIAVTGVYNKDGKTLTETTDLSKDFFYLVVEGKDQYGKEVSTDLLNGLILNNTNKTIVDVASSFETLTIDGKEKTVLKLTGTPKSGETTVMLISTANGKSTSYTVKVEEAQRADTLKFEVPALAVANEKLFVPVTVFDKDGKEITDLEVINNATRGISVTGATNTIKKNADGVIGVEIAAGNVTEGYLTLVGLSSTAKSEIANVEIKAAAKPTVIRGLAKEVSKVLTGNKTINAADVVVEDQYGRAMTSETTPLTLAADENAASGYRIAVADNAANTVLGNAGTTSYIYASTGAELVKGTNGTEKVEFKLQQKVNGAWTDLSNSAQEVTFEVTDGTEYVSYEVKEIGSLLDEAGAKLSENASYTKDVVVYGVLPSGNKVALGTDAYSVDVPKFVTYTDGKVNVTSADSSEVNYGEATSVEANVVVTVNATGEQFTQKVTVSKAAPTVADFKVVAAGETASTVTEFNNLTELTDVTVTANTVTANTLVDFVLVDSYGVVHTVGTVSEFVPTIKLVGTPAVANTVTLSLQNTYDLAISSIEKGEKVTVKANVSGIEKSFTVTGAYEAE